MRYFTFSSSPSDKRLAVLVRTCEYYSIPLDIIPCNHTKEKPTRFLDYTQNLPSSDLACCIDGFDVMALRSPQHDELSYLKDQDYIVFGAERFCFHHFPQVQKFFESTGDSRLYRYLNGGMFAGKLSLLRTMMEEILSWNLRELESEFALTAKPGNNFNDQTLFGLYLLRNSERVFLDRNARTFWNVWGEYEGIYQNFVHDGTVGTNKYSQSTPLFLHASQIDKYYCVYVSLASKACSELKISDIDVSLFRQILKHSDVENRTADQKPTDDTLSRIQRSFKYRRIDLMESFSRCLRYAKHEASRLKRRLLGALDK